MLVYKEFLKLNEDMASFDPKDKLRGAVHEIIINLKNEEFITFKEMAEALKKNYNININEDLLKKILERWDRFNDPDYSIFKKGDKSWMDVFIYQNKAKKTFKSKQVFGKHRKVDYFSKNYWKPDKWHW